GRGGGAGLGEVAPVQRRGGREREHEPAGDRPAHSCSRLPKGRYASAASAAIPTRGRSSRFSYTTKRRCQVGKNLRLKSSRLSSWKCPLSRSSARRSSRCRAESSASGASSAAKGAKFSDTRLKPSLRAQSIAT